MGLPLLQLDERRTGTHFLTAHVLLRSIFFLVNGQVGGANRPLTLTVHRLRVRARLLRVYRLVIHRLLRNQGRPIVTELVGSLPTTHGLVKAVGLACCRRRHTIVRLGLVLISVLE